MRFLIHCLLVTAGLAQLGTPCAADTVRVFVLAGQSNMEGQGVVDLDHPEHYNGGKGTLRAVMAVPQKSASFAHTVHADGSWRERDDVFVRFQARHGLMKGPLTIGYTGYPGRHHIGPEFQFGHVVGDALSDPVLLIKTAWGGKSLFRDFRPPSSGGDVGPYYTRMIAEVRTALENIATDFPALADHSVQLSGFVWMQGWNDMVSDDATAEYAVNLKNLITDVRTEFKAPDLPVVVGELGNGGRRANPKMQAFRDAQHAGVALLQTSSDRTDQLSPRVLFVPTAEFARPPQSSPNVGHGHHWFGNAESYFLIGDALGHSVLEAMRLDGHRVLRDIPYKTGENLTASEAARCRLDVYVPDVPVQQLSQTPVLVWFHGGGLTAGSKDVAHAKIVGREMAGSGVICLMVNYRLSPEVSYPAYVEDAAAAVAWALRRYGPRDDSPGNPIFVGGHSAGAYLTMMVALDEKYLTAHGLRLSQVRGWLPVSAQVDSHWTVRRERGIPVSQQVIDGSAPLFHTRADTPAMLVVVADNDLKGRAALNRRFVEKMHEVGHTDTKYVEVPDRDHGSLIGRLRQPNDAVSRLLVQFIQAHTRRTTLEKGQKNVR